MAHNVAECLTETMSTRKPGQTIEMPDVPSKADLRRLSVETNQSSILMPILGLTALGFAAVMGYYFGPELARYIKMSRM